eukprot:6482339-Amphidinium_carterae.1
MPRNAQLWWPCKCGSWAWAKQDKCRACGRQAPSWAKQASAQKPPEQTVADADGFVPVPKGRAARRRATRLAKQKPAPESALDSAMQVGEDAELSLGTGTESRDALASKLKHLEEGHKLLHDSAPPVVAEQLLAAIEATKLELRRTAPTPKRLQSMQVSIERRQQRIEKLDVRLSETAASLASLESDMQKELALVRSKFVAKKAEYTALAESLQSQRDAATEALIDIRQDQVELLAPDEGISKDFQAMQRITSLLKSRMPMYQQVWHEIESVAREQVLQEQGAVEPGAVQAGGNIVREQNRPAGDIAAQQVAAPILVPDEAAEGEPVPKRGRMAGAGVFETPPSTDIVDEVQPTLPDTPMESQVPPRDRSRERSPKGRQREQCG